MRRFKRRGWRKTYLVSSLKGPTGRTGSSWKDREKFLNWVRFFIFSGCVWSLLTLRFQKEVCEKTVDGVQKSGESPVEGKVVYPIIYKVLYMSGGAGFLPSTVCLIRSIQRFHEFCWKVYYFASNFSPPKNCHQLILWFLLVEMGCFLATNWISWGV